MRKKYYELTRGEQALHERELLTFIKMDGAYAQWEDGNGEIVIGNALEYERGEDGIYIPL